MLCFARIKQPCRIFLNCTNRFSTLSKNVELNAFKAQLSRPTESGLLVGCNLQLDQVRYSTSFFTRLPGDFLWKGVTSVSAAGKKRGRGKGAGKKLAKDLNKGQVMGVGRINMVWPGLNAPVIKGRETLSQKKLPPNKDYITNLLRVRNEMDTFSRRKTHALERGWSGSTMTGKWFGPPVPVHDETFIGFDSKVIMLRSQSNMTALTGKVRHIVAMVVTGNKNGLAGFEKAAGRDGRSALNKAKKRAAQRLCYVERDGKTIIHDFYSRFGCTHVYAFKKPPGYGMVAHRVIREICKVVGIDDIYVKVTGVTDNIVHVTRAFFLGLQQQKSFQQLADEKALHIVEMTPENDYYPVVRASPSSGIVRKKEEIQSEEVTDFRMHINDGKIIEYKAPKLPHYTETEGYLKYLQGWHYNKARQSVRVALRAKYGQLDSFLTVREREERKRRKLALSLEGSESDSVQQEQASG